MQNDEFIRIPHIGGKITFQAIADDKGEIKHSCSYSFKAKTPAAMFVIYALPPGIPIASGLFSEKGNSPVPSSSYLPFSFPMTIGSDKEGKFGRKCFQCNSYWRGEGRVNLYCPYCGIKSYFHNFLTEPQRQYVSHYCHTLNDFMVSSEIGECIIIDLDIIADKANTEIDSFNYQFSEESQQNKFDCEVCKTSNDILGLYGYCSGCGTRNNLQELKTRKFPQLYKKINTIKSEYEDTLKELVSVFDSFTNDYIKQLLNRIPLTRSRRSSFENSNFHNLERTKFNLQNIFDINIFEDIKDEDIEFAILMFHRRHVYEHKGGVVDQKYMKDSGDKEARLGQKIHETKEKIERFLGIVKAMLTNLQKKFHEIFPSY